MRELNSRFRGVDKTTDVLSFPMGDTSFGDAGPLGDIVISVPRAEMQAREYGVTFRDELLRLLVHGLLHLVGYDHEINPYQKRKMEKKERELLDAL
jgi:probable rRNA maturation factor